MRLFSLFWLYQVFRIWCVFQAYGHLHSDQSYFKSHGDQNPHIRQHVLDLLPLSLGTATSPNVCFALTLH